MRTETHPLGGPSLVHDGDAHRIDAWLLRRLSSRMGRAPLGYALGRFTARARNGRWPRCASATAARCLGLLSRPRSCTSVTPTPTAASRSRATWWPPSRRPTAGLEGTRPRAARPGCGAWRRHPPRRSRAERPPPLRPRQRLLPPLARRAAASTPAPTSSPPRPSLEEAQVAKMDHVCRKLGLRPGETRGRGRLRLGRPRPAHGAPLRRAGARLQRLPRAGRSCAASGPSARG